MQARMKSVTCKTVKGNNDGINHKTKTYLHYNAVIYLFFEFYLFIDINYQVLCVALLYVLQAEPRVTPAITVVTGQTQEYTLVGLR